MAVPANFFVNVATYQKPMLALLQNSFFFINKSNKKYLNFQNEPAQLGQTVQFKLPSRFTTTNSLVANFQPYQDRFLSLTVNKEVSSSVAFTNQQIIYYLENHSREDEYMKEIGRPAVAEIGTQIESDMATMCETVPFRFFGNGLGNINTYGQLARSEAFFRNFGAPNMTGECVIPDLAVPPIIDSGLSQFATDRNNEIANSWELGSFGKMNYSKSNLLPIHQSGVIGDSNPAKTLTVTGTTLDANGAVIAITATVGGGMVNEPNAIFLNDRIQFNDGVAGFPNLRFRTWIGHKVSGAPVQVRATAAAGTNGASSVTIPIYPPLQAGATNEQNLNVAIQAGMQFTVMPSHRAGIMYADDILFLALPQMPNEVPFPTANMIDTDSGASLRMYFGSKFGQNQRGMVHDGIYGFAMPPENTMAMLFPV